MKKTILITGFMCLFIVTTAMQCDDDTFTYDCEENIAYLEEYKLTIESMAAASICNENFECRYIAFGSKPCGGPWEFLVYSTSIDTLALTNAVADYNQMEANYNINCGAISDCSAPIPPVDFTCENNQCIPIF
jgi:hypothetical protein